MRDFETFTRGSRPARRRKWLWASPVAAVVLALLVGVGVQGGAFPLEKTLGFGGEPVDSLNATPTASQGPAQTGAEAAEVVEERLNVLVLGVDRRPDSEEGARSDTIMLAQLDSRTGEVRLLSMPRDLLVEVRPGEQDRINAAYSYGGIEGAKAAFENYSDIQVDRYAVIDFEGFENVIDAIGGVKIDVEGEFPEKWNMEEGVQHLNGARALFYARYRGTEGGDLDRMERQQQMVAALRSKALRWRTLKRLPEIVNVMQENVQTDISLDEAFALGRALIQQGRNAKMTSTQLKGTPKALPNGNQVLVPDEAANDAALREFR